MDGRRILKHLLMPAWRVRRLFPAEALRAIGEAIAASERTHGGQIRFAVEASLDLSPLRRGISARECAIAAFAELGVWDTEDNNGVLIYLLLADRDVEIVVDRGLRQRVGDEVWRSICTEMEGAFRAGRFREGVLTGITRCGQELARHFPPGAAPVNELPDEPVLR